MKVFSIQYILSKVADYFSLTTDIIDALNAANSPSTGNPFATMADVVSGSGDMTKAMYDPTNVEGDAFDRSLHHGNITVSVISDFTTESQTLIDASITALGLGTAATTDSSDYLSSATNSVQDGYFGSVKLIDTDSSNYLNIFFDEDVAADYNLRIQITGATRLLRLTGDVSLSGSNNGDQTSIVGISGTKSEFDTACSDGNFVFNGDVITSLFGTKSDFNSACTDGDFLFVGDVTQYTTEMAQDAIGAMVDSSLVYVDGTPLLSRAALTGDVTASQGSNSTTIANDAVTFAKMQNIAQAQILGRYSVGTGDIQLLTVSTGLTIDGSGNLSANASSAISRVNWRVFTSGSGTYTPTTGTKYVTVYCTGGGGGSSDCTNTDACTGGGGGAGTAIKTYAVADATGQSYSVGGGGARGNPASNGTDSTFAGLTGTGGIAGGIQPTGATTNIGIAGFGAVGSGGDINIRGGGGGPGIIVSTTQGVGGTGGSSFWGGGANCVAMDSAGSDGQNYGGGASGAHSVGATDRLGGTGGPGVIVFVEYIS